jgi:hypothetical protein
MAKRESFVLPVGAAVHPKLGKTDVYQGKDTKKYRCGQTLPDAALTKLRQKLKEAAEAEGLTKYEIIAIKTDKEGKPFVRASSQYKPPVFDTRNNEITNDVIVGGGSQIAMYVAINVNRDRKEVGLYLNGVQVVDLKEGRGASPFEKREDGFVLEANTEEDKRSEMKPIQKASDGTFDF